MRTGFPHVFCLASIVWEEEGRKRGEKGGKREDTQEKLDCFLEKVSSAQLCHKPHHSLMSSTESVTHSVTCLSPKGSNFEI